MVTQDDLGKRVRVGDEIEGEIVGHSISPQVLIKMDNGEKIWRRDILCEIIPERIAIYREAYQRLMDCLYDEGMIIANVRICINKIMEEIDGTTSAKSEG